MLVHTRILLACAVFAAAAPLIGQDTDRVDVRSAIRQARGTADVPGGVLGGAWNYEAVLRDGAMQFVPALGDRAPEVLPLTFELESIRRGTAEVFDPSRRERPTPRRDASSMWFDRGDGILERYEVRVDGLEQTFTFAAPLAGCGDLVVRGRITTSLQGTIAADGSVCFLREGVGGVRFGTVTGIDALGNHTAGTLRLDGEHLELVLPARFVDGATYPIVLDPLIGTQFEANGSTGTTQDDVDVDVAYDAQTNRYLIAWQRKFALAGSRIRAQLLSASGTPWSGTLLFADPTQPISSHPRVANIRSRHGFLIVWQVMPMPAGSRDIRAAAVDAVTGIQSNIISVAASGDDEHDPCISGEATTADDDALVAWIDSTGVRVQQIEVPSAGDPTPIGPILAVGTPLSREPFLSKSGGTTGRHVLGYTQGDPVADDEIVVQGLTRDAVLLGPALTLTNNATTDANGAVDGNGSSFLVVWQQLVAGDFDIHGRILSLTTAGLSLATTEQTISMFGYDEVRPDVCSLGDKYAAFWVQQYTTVFGDDIYGVLVNPDCSNCGYRMMTNGVNNGKQDAPRVIGQAAGGAVSDEGMLVFVDSQLYPPFDSDIVGQRFEALGPGTPALVLGPGCGNGGSAGTNGPFVVGNDAFQFLLTGADPAAVLFLAISFPGAPLLCGACSLVNPVSLSLKTNVVGNAVSPFPVPCSGAFVGLPLEFQWVSFLTASSPCPQAPSLSASSRLQLTIGP